MYDKENRLYWIHANSSFFCSSLGTKCTWPRYLLIMLYFSENQIEGTTQTFHVAEGCASFPNG